MNGYLQATRHPWTCLIFITPLLLIYEIGLFYLERDQLSGIRNGADAWLRWWLAQYGITWKWAPPLGVLLLFIFRSWLKWDSRPKEPWATGLGMALESVIFAVVLWTLNRNFHFLLNYYAPDWQLQIAFQPIATQQLLTYIGAGIYEEVIFRLVLFSVILIILRLVPILSWAAMLLAAVAAALLFALAHYVDQDLTQVNRLEFLFRVTAGLIFTGVYISRGLGVAVGSHAGYDILAGLTVQ